MLRYTLWGCRNGISTWVARVRKFERTNRITLRDLWVLGTVTIFCAFLQFVSALAGTPWSFVAGAGCGVLLPLLLSYLEIRELSVWLRIGLVASANLSGAGLVAVSRNNFADVWIAPVAGTVSAWLWWVFQSRSKRRCGLCDDRISSAGMSFDCPRCGLTVCEQKCWSFERQRCSLCEQNRVPVLPVDARWWDRQLGPRSTFGQCQVCFQPAELADLRNCAKCGRPQCRGCWDYGNGQCPRCQWVIEDLPEELRRYTETARTNLHERKNA